VGHEQVSRVGQDQLRDVAAAVRLAEGEVRLGGRRRIAARLERPPGTVRGGLRAFARRAELIGATASRWAHAIDPHESVRPCPAGSQVADAVDALGSMARACRLQLRMSASPWELAVALTGLLYGRPRDPPGF
jgi:hypothetical protein